MSGAALPIPLHVCLHGMETASFTFLICVVYLLTDCESGSIHCDEYKTNEMSRLNVTSCTLVDKYERNGKNTTAFITGTWQWIKRTAPKRRYVPSNTTRRHNPEYDNREQLQLNSATR
jgi:hypothetical protein